MFFMFLGKSKVKKQGTYEERRTTYCRAPARPVMMAAPVPSLGTYLFEEGVSRGMYSDIVLRVSNKAIPDRVQYEQRLHRLILCQSPYFRRGIEILGDNMPSVLDVSVVDPNITTRAIEYAIAVLYGAPLTDLEEDELLQTLVRRRLLHASRIHCTRVVFLSWYTHIHIYIYCRK